jgi:hypothetical protein
MSYLLPTPREEKHSPQSREDFTPNLAARIQMLPTPVSSDSGHGHAGTWTTTQISLHNVIEGKGKQLDGSVIPAALGKNPGLKLQPAFVEWMMGFPESWTEVKD